MCPQPASTTSRDGWWVALSVLPQLPALKKGEHEVGARVLGQRQQRPFDLAAGRVAAEGEHQGMDLYELGAGAYPEFMTHTDEFMR